MFASKVAKKKKKKRIQRIKGEKRYRMIYPEDSRLNSLKNKVTKNIRYR